MQIRNFKASRRVKLPMNKFVSFSAEGKFSVEINTERLHTVPADTVSSVCICCFLVHIYLPGTCYLGLEINGSKPNINTTFEASFYTRQKARARAWKQIIWRGY